MIVVLTGGTGGAKFVDGLRQAVSPKELTVIVNTGDDLEWWGLYVSPDVDSITYVLAGMLSNERGWGVKGDTFFCLEAMGRLDLHDKVFHALHEEKLRFVRDEAGVVDWVSKNGVDKAKFLDFWNSFGVLTKLKRSIQIVSNYKVDGAPTLVVDGRYVTSPSMINAGTPGLTEPQLGAGTLQVLDVLVAKVQKDSKPATSSAKAAAK